MLLAVVISYLSGVFGNKHRLDAETCNALIITANGPAIWRACPASAGAEREVQIPSNLDRDSEEPACRVGMLPDASTGQSLGTLAEKLSRCKEGEPAPQERSACGGALFAVRVQVLFSITRVAVQVLLEPVNYHGTGCLLGALAQCPARGCLGA
jgi:hypothetical protein